MALAREELGWEIRALMRAQRHAMLSTGQAAADNWPYGSLVTVAIDQAGCPILLLSGLSDHTRNIDADNRASLLFHQSTRHRNPQRSPRVTVMGKVRRTHKSEHAQRFLAMHPEAEMYAGFGAFNFYRMSVERAHCVGGFAQAQWLAGRHVQSEAKAAKALAGAQAGITAHMNADHADAVDLYAQNLLKRRGQGWRIIGVDCDGADLERNGRFVRLGFPVRVKNAPDVRNVFVRLASDARGVAAP